MLSPLTAYFEKQEEPVKSYLGFLRAHILQQDTAISEKLSYGMPFYYFGNKRFCYLWTSKKQGWPYLGIVEGSKVHHPELLQEQRKKMKILLLDPSKDIPVPLVDAVLQEMLRLYR